MTAKAIVLAVLLGSLASRALAQDADSGRALRAALAKEGVRGALVAAPHERHYTLYAGYGHAGELVLDTELHRVGGEDLYHVEDRLTFRAVGFPEVAMRVTGDLASDLSVRSLVLETNGPTGKGGALVDRLLSVAPEGDALWVTETVGEQRPVKRKLPVARDALILTPPLGVGVRLAGLARDARSLAFPGLDLAREEPVVFAISSGDGGTVDLRGSAVPARRVVTSTGDGELESWIDDSGRPVSLTLLLGGRLTALLDPPSANSWQQRANQDDLPVPAQAGEDPVDVVLHFLRASATSPEPDAATITSLVDLRALASGLEPAPTDAPVGEALRKVLLRELAADTWQRGGLARTLTLASRREDWVVDAAGDHATVTAKGLPPSCAFQLSREDGAWRITGLPTGGAEETASIAPETSSGALAVSGESQAGAFAFLGGLVFLGVALFYLMLRSRK